MRQLCCSPRTCVARTASRQEKRRALGFQKTESLCPAYEAPGLRVRAALRGKRSGCGPQRASSASGSEGAGSDEPDDSDTGLMELPGPASPSTPSNALILHLLASGQEFLVPGTVEQRLLALDQERPEGLGTPASTASDSFDSPEAVLARRIAEVREKDRRREVVSLLYLAWAARLQASGAPMHHGSGQNSIEEEAKRADGAVRLLGPALHDAVTGHLAGVLGSTDSTPSETVARVSADQLAGLYLGTVEFGYFLRTVTAKMTACGMDPGNRDCTALLDFAESLPPEVISEATEISSEEALQAAYHHVGALFSMTPADEEGPLGPIYPDLTSHSAAEIAPSAHMAEHFDDDGTAEDLKAQAASKMDRGWADSAQRDLQDAQNVLPSAPTMVETTVEYLRGLLLHAGAMGCALWDTEHEICETTRLTARQYLHEDGSEFL